MLVRYAGEEKELCEFKAVVAIANPFNLNKCAENIHKWPRAVYHESILRNFKVNVRRNEAQLRLNPRIDVGMRESFALSS